MKTEQASPLCGRRVLVAVSGSIAAVKTPLLVSALVKAGAEVRCLVTPSAAKLVSPLALASLPVEIEYEDGVISQFPVVSVGAGDMVTVHLGTKHTDCLAKEVCLPPAAGSAAECCAPGSNCC